MNRNLPYQAQKPICFSFQIFLIYISLNIELSTIQWYIQFAYDNQFAKGKSESVAVTFAIKL